MSTVPRLGNNSISLEGLMKYFKIIFISFFLLFISQVWAESSALSKKLIKEVGTFYYRNMFGHIHQNASRYSVSLTTVSCGHPVTVISSKNEEKKTDGWVMVKAGPYEGYLLENSLSEKRVDCFQDRYVKFFDNMDLPLTDMYYWGRFYDQLVEGKSKVR